MNNRFVWSVLFVLCASGAAAQAVPVPLPDKPGNVCLEGDRLNVSVPAVFASATRWEARDLEGGVVAQGACVKGFRHVDAGVLPIGWYRIEGLDAAGKCCAWTTAAVLKRLAVPVPADSPVRIDTADAWFTRTGNPEGDLKKMSAFASLAALAGVSGARDRLTWSEIEPSAGTFATQTRYDDSARIMRKAGLEVLQVFHGTPAWARTPRLEETDGGRRFPRDLRDHYRFCKAMAGRFNGMIQAWEPWNEANIPGFGGQIIDEMCSLQKASYLGFKAGDPDVTVCWNVFAGSGSTLHTQGVIDNACWPYYDTYNNHSYSATEQYVKEFATAREGACGKPLWISECGIHVHWNADHGDLPATEEVRQARFVPKSYASSLFAGVSRHYFFILGNYCETKIQFGLLRHDLTPRRGYLALAAVGRLLAGAQPLGRMTNGTARVYAFRAQPDGREREVLVAWADKGTTPATFLQGLALESVYDVYGRLLKHGLPHELTEAPVFAVLAPSGGTVPLALERPFTVSPAPAQADCSPVVMQVLLPQAQTRLDIQAHQVELGVENTIPVALYNFSDVAVKGTLQAADLPEGWRLTLPLRRIGLRPLERQVLAVKMLIPETAGRPALYGAPVTLRGAFGKAGESVLSFRLACAASAVRPASETPVASARQVSAWTDNIAGGAKMTHAAKESQMLFFMSFKEQDPWGYPRLKLAAGERPPAGADGLMAEVEVLEGTGTLRVQFVEEGGACYLGELPYAFKKGGKQRLMAFFDKATWGGHSRPDEDGKLTPAEISGLMIGINAQRNSCVRLAVGDLRWVRY